VEVTLDSTQSRLILKDTTKPPSSGQTPAFGVQAAALPVGLVALGTSPAAYLLGILGVPSDDKGVSLDTLPGQPLFGAPNSDRFFVLEGSKVFASAKLHADNIELGAGLGLFELGISGGEVNFHIDAGLTLADPGTGAGGNDGKIRISDFQSTQ